MGSQALSQGIGVGLAVSVAANRRHGGAQDAVVKVDGGIGSLDGLFFFGAKDAGVLAACGVNGGIEEIRVRGVLLKGLTGALEFFAFAVNAGESCGVHHRGIDALLAGVEEEYGFARKHPAIGGAEEVHGRDHGDESNDEQATEDFQYRFHSFRRPVRNT